MHLVRRADVVAVEPEPTVTRARVGVGALVILLAVSIAWGHRVTAHAARSIELGALPFFGHWELGSVSGLLVAAGVAAMLVGTLPGAAASWPWRRAMAAVAGSSVAFSTALTFVDLASGRWQSIHDDYGRYVSLIDAAGGPGAFLRSYVDAQPHLPTHLSAHPPGLPLLLWTAEHVGLAGVTFESVLAIVGAAVAAVAALVALRELGGEDVARRAAPFAVIAPAAIWHTNADAFFAGVAMSAVALVIVAIGRDNRRSAALAALGGALFGGALLLTYGVAALALAMGVVALARRCWRPLRIAAAATIAVLAVPTLWGFSWLAGLQATKAAYEANLADVRPYLFFVVANLAVVGAAIGPAAVVGLTRVHEPGVRLLVGAGAAVVLVADLSGLSSGETERIWQPFLPLLVVAAVAAAHGPRWDARRWLALQAATTVALDALLRSPW